MGRWKAQFFKFSLCCDQVAIDLASPHDRGQCIGLPKLLLLTALEPCDAEDDAGAWVVTPPSLGAFVALDADENGVLDAADFDLRARRQVKIHERGTMQH